MLASTVSARLGTMRRAESIHDVHVAQRGHFLREALIALFLAFEKTHILEQHDVARRHIDAVYPVLDERHVATE